MGIAVGGLASGIDSESIISQLVQLERRPILRLQERESSYQVQLTTVGSLQSLLGDLKTAAEALTEAQDLTSFTTTVGDISILRASSAETATPGTYNITVSQLAQNHKLKSIAFSSSSSVLGEGTIHLQVGNGSITDISVSATDSISDIADAINEADTGVMATIIFDGTDHFLTLTSEDSGAENSINLTVTDSDGDHTDSISGLSRLVYDAVTKNMTQTQEAKDAIIDVDGIIGIARASNTISDVVPGVTLTLKEAPTAPDNVTSLTISRSAGPIKDKLEKFLTAYNAALGFITERQTYNADNEIAGPLLGDSTANLVRRQLENLTHTTVTGASKAVQTLSDLGVTRSAEGKFELRDASALEQALKDDFEGVVQFFTQTTPSAKGFANKVLDVMGGLLQSDTGALAARRDGINRNIEHIQQDVQRKELRISAIEENLRQQFTAMETLISQFRSTESFLAQQITGLQNLNQAIANR